MNKVIIKTKTINFDELVKSGKISIDFKSKLVDKINYNFTEKEQQWYIANLFLFLNYDSINEFPIDLECAYKTIGFANKNNAKRSLKNNFTENVDYKITVTHKDENLTKKDEFLSPKSVIEFL